MLSLEVAGVLLGVLPILFKAVDLSKDGIQRSRVFFRKRIYVDKLARAVLLQQRTLAETVKSLLIESGCEDVALLDDDPVGYLNDKSIGSQVLDYLGSANSAAFSGALKESGDIAKKIARNIVGLVPVVKDPTDDLSRIIAANRDANGRQLDVILRVKLMFGVNDLESAVRELDDTTEKLCRFTSIISSNRQLIEDKPSLQELFARFGGLPVTYI